MALKEERSRIVNFTTQIHSSLKEVQPIGRTSFLTFCYPLVIFSELSIITIVGFEIPDRNRGAGMRTKDQGTLDKILKFVNKYDRIILWIKA